MSYNKYYWLNDESRQFLSRGYITESPEQRIKDIARIAEKHLNIKGFAEKFEDYMSKGYYSLSTPVWINFGKQKGLPISCLTGDSWINTYNEGGKQIKDINIGDKVLTHKGRYRKVINKQVRKSTNDLYELKVQTRLTPIKITGNHPVLTNRGWVRVDELNKNEHYIATNYKINHESKNTLIKFKNPEEKNNSQFISKNIKDINVDKDFAWALGLWFAEGSLSTNKGNPNGIRITMGSHEKETVDRFLKIITTKTGLNGNIYESKVTRKNKVNTWLNCNINSTILGEYFRDNFGTSCKTKNITIWIKELPLDILNEFVKGFYDGDGKKAGDSKYFTISNPELAMSLYEISLRCDYYVGLQMQAKPGKLATTKYVYRVCYYKDDKNISLNRNNKDSSIIFGDLRYCPFNLKKLEHNEDVYDITVEEDHSFSVAGVVVHNCYGSNIDDNLDSILNAGREIGMMSKYGGGTSAYLGNIRARGSQISTGGTADGPVHYARIYDTIVDVCKQSEARRGACAVYLPIEHPDILEFLDIGTEGNLIQNLQYGITVGDNWLDQMRAGDSDKRKIWAKVIQRRNEFGFPYIMFKDNSNNNSPYKELGMEITASNLCSEIQLPTDSFNSFVCCLGSINLLHWDEIVETDAIETYTLFLNAVMDEFINKSATLPGMIRAYNFARKHRALGLGVLGWHSYLQSKLIPFESMEAKFQNAIIFKTLKERSEDASKELCEIGNVKSIRPGYANTTLIAIAPTKSSSFIHGQVSMGIEPIKSNYFIKDLAKTKTVYKNPFLKKELQKYNLDTSEVWESILKKDGSVQHLDFPTKEVFKSFIEISPKEIIIQAAQRQKYIDQSQSLNLMIHPEVPAKDINQLYLFAHEAGVKTLYYQFSMSSAQAFARNILECASCEG
jgi:ribonucleoside-diphosphate reductase alpha chain